MNFKRTTKLMLILTLTLNFLEAGIVLSSEPRLIKKYPIPGHGELELTVSNGWKSEIHRSQEFMPPTLIFSPKKGNDFQLLITVLWDAAGKQDFRSPDKLKAFVMKDGQKLLPKAIEKELTVQQMRGIHSIGYFYTLTDKAPNPGEFRYMTRGGLAVGNLLLNFTVLYRKENSPFFAEALSVLREAKQNEK